MAFLLVSLAFQFAHWSETKTYIKHTRMFFAISKGDGCTLVEI